MFCISVFVGCFVLFCFLTLQLRLFLHDMATPTTEKSDLADQVTAYSENRGAGVNWYRLSQLRWALLPHASTGAHMVSYYEPIKVFGRQEQNLGQC